MLKQGDLVSQAGDPPLSENIMLTGGAAMLTPGDGFRDIYGGKTLFSLFGSVKLTF